MYIDEIEILLSDIEHLDRHKAKWENKEPKVVGFCVDRDHVVMPWGEGFPNLPANVNSGFLALSGTPDPMKCHPTVETNCNIGLELAHAFPRTVAGELSGVVETGKGLRLLSVNHVVWMNGWAQPTTKIVSKPFGNPKFLTIGFVVSDPSENCPLIGCFGSEKERCDHVNITEELALADVASQRETTPYEFARCENAYGDIQQPLDCDPCEPVFRLDCCCEMREARVVCTDFRLAQRFEYGRFLFKRQILLQDTNMQQGNDLCGNPQRIPFATRGNSGALLYQKHDGGYAPVAVLWAGTPDHQGSNASQSFYIATPLKEHFKAKNWKFCYYRIPPKDRED